MNEQILALLQQYAPTLVAVVGIVVSCFKSVKKVNISVDDLKKTNSKKVNELLEINKALITDNQELKKQLKEINEQLTKVKK